MTAKSTAAIIFIFVCNLPQTLLSQNNKGAERYFRTVLQKVRTEFNVPALGGVLVIDGKIVVAGAYGVRKQGAVIAVTDNDRFPIGSISKTFTGFLAARLTQPNNYVLGVLTWDTKIGDVFPDLATTAGIYSDYLNKTLAQFTTHQSSLPGDTIDESSTCDRTNFHQYMVCGRNQHMIRSMKRPLEPATIYSNIGPVIAANMAQKRTGKTWEELITEYIFTPLDLSATFISSLDFNNVSDPQWHVENGAANTAVLYGVNDKYNIAAPAGHIMISPKDMGKYLIELMPGAADRVGALTPNILNEYLEQYTPNRNVTKGGWFIDNSMVPNYWAPGEKVLQHNGSHGFNYSIANLLPDAKVAFCSMSNSACNPKICGTARGVQASDKLNEHFRYMWFNRNVLPFFEEESSFTITAATKSPSINQVFNKMKDEDMLTTWKATSSGSSLLLSTNNSLTSIKGLVIIYPRGQQNIKSISIYGMQGNKEIPVHTDKEIGQHHSIFEFDPAIASSTLRVKFENQPNKTTEIAEILFLYDDPLNKMADKLKTIKAIDKKVIQPPPLLRIKKSASQSNLQK